MMLVVLESTLEKIHVLVNVISTSSKMSISEVMEILMVGAREPTAVCFHNYYISQVIFNWFMKAQSLYEHTLTNDRFNVNFL